MRDPTMRTEKEKMLAGEPYDPLDSELVQARSRARDFCRDLNATREKDNEERRRILKELFGKGGESVWMEPPFFCDYGSNILLGERVFFNFNCVVLDVCQLKVGDFTLFGPAVLNCGGSKNLPSPSRSGRTCGSAAVRPFAQA
jgi:maltose O-acetyltransferase